MEIAGFFHENVSQLMMLIGPPMGFHGMQDKALFVRGIRDWLQNFAGYEIKEE